MGARRANRSNNGMNTARAGPAQARQTGQNTPARHFLRSPARPPPRERCALCRSGCHRPADRPGERSIENPDCATATSPGAHIPVRGRCRSHPRYAWRNSEHWNPALSSIPKHKLRPATVAANSIAAKRRHAGGDCGRHRILQRCDLSSSPLLLQSLGSLNPKYRVRRNTLRWT